MTMTDPEKMDKQELNYGAATELFGSACPDGQDPPSNGFGVKSKDGLWEYYGGNHWKPIDFHTGDGLLRVIEMMRDRGYDYQLRSQGIKSVAIFAHPSGAGGSALCVSPETAALTAAIKAIRSERDHEV